MGDLEELASAAKWNAGGRSYSAPRIQSESTHPILKGFLMSIGAAPLIFGAMFFAMQAHDAVVKAELQDAIDKLRERINTLSESAREPTIPPARPQKKY